MPLNRYPVGKGLVCVGAAGMRAPGHDRPDVRLAVVGRMVTAVVTFAGRCVGQTGPFPVDDPWRAQAEPVTTAIHARYGFRVYVLRLLAVEGSDGARDGHVTYHVEALEPPGGLRPCGFVADDHPLRMAWARPDGLRALLAWAAAPSGIRIGNARVSTGGQKLERKAVAAQLAKATGNLDAHIAAPRIAVPSDAAGQDLRLRRVSPRRSVGVRRGFAYDHRRAEYAGPSPS